MHTVQLQNARIYLNQRYLVEQIESGFFYIPEAAPWLAEYLHEIEYQENSTMPSHLSLSFVIGGPPQLQGSGPSGGGKIALKDGRGLRQILSR